MLRNTKVELQKGSGCNTKVELQKGSGCNTIVELGPKALQNLDFPKVSRHFSGASIVQGGAFINQVPTLLSGFWAKMWLSFSLCEGELMYFRNWKTANASRKP